LKIVFDYLHPQRNSKSLQTFHVCISGARGFCPLISKHFSSAERVVPDVVTRSRLAVFKRYLAHCHLTSDTVEPSGRLLVVEAVWPSFSSV
jgi:hypothetical protein